MKERLIEHFTHAALKGTLVCKGRPHAGGLRPKFVVRYDTDTKSIVVTSHDDFRAEIRIRDALLSLDDENEDKVDEAEQYSDGFQYALENRHHSVRIRGQTIEEADCIGSITVSFGKDEEGVRYPTSACIRLDCVLDELADFWLELTLVIQ